jgi:hypothetical protein
MAWGVRAGAEAVKPTRAWARVGGAPTRLRWLKVEGSTNVSGAAGGPMWVKAAPVAGGRTPEVRGGGARTVVVVAGTLCGDCFRLG